MADVFRELGVTDKAALAALRDGALQAQAMAQQTLELARAALDEATRLDAHLAKLDPLARTLDALHSALGDGKFKRFVAARKEQRLLGVATTILGRMTNARYGFGTEMRIVDRSAGQERSPRTLSGGEKFLASLALAFALVEIAARSGGHFGALFLDEGFGALDVHALDQALSELERQATGGRTIGVITHVREVTEYIDDVLRVWRTPAGSDVALGPCRSGRTRCRNRHPRPRRCVGADTRLLKPAARSRLPDRPYGWRYRARDCGPPATVYDPDDSTYRGDDMPIEIRLDPISDEKLAAISRANPGYRFERSPEGNLIVSPTSLFPSGGKGELYVQIYNWTKRTRLGRAFPATGGFTLPDTAIKAADTSYFANERLLGTESSQDAFPLLAPTAAFELMSPTDDLAESISNVKKYIDNGSDVGVLITKTSAVMVARPGAEEFVTHTTPFVEIGPEMPGFVLDVDEIIHAQRKGI